MHSLSFRSTFSLVFAAAVVSGLGDGLIPIAFALRAQTSRLSGRRPQVSGVFKVIATRVILGSASTKVVTC